MFADVIDFVVTQESCKMTYLPCLCALEVHCQCACS
jgi:hypothetical protein